MFIFLDDHRNVGEVTWVELPKLPPFGKWIVVRSYDEFVEELEHPAYELTLGPRHISFDHDLGWGHGKRDFEEKNGYDCAMHYISLMIDKGWRLPNTTIHSLNPVGAKRISEALKDYERYLRIAG